MTEREASDRPRTVESIRQGFRYIRRDNIQVGLLALLIGGYWVAGLNSLQTPLAKQVLLITDGQFGWFQSVGGLGYVTASLLLGWYGKALPKGQTVVFAYLLWATAAATMGLSLNYGMLLITGFWVGFANMLVFVSVGTIMMEYTPSKMIGRTVTTRQTVVALMRALALLGFGWMADRLGIRTAILIMAGTSMIGTLIAALRSPAVWYYCSAELIEGPPYEEHFRRRDRPLISHKLLSIIQPLPDEQFSLEEQGRLNRAVLIVGGAGWAIFLIVDSMHALAVLVAVVATLSLAALVRTVGRHISDWRKHDDAHAAPNKV